MTHIDGNHLIYPPGGGKPKEITPEEFAKRHHAPRWVLMYVDGGTLGRNPNSRGVYWSLRVEQWKDRLDPIRKQSHQFHTNNDAEWLAVREALAFAVEQRISDPILIWSDSKLVVNQFNNRWRTKIARHAKLHHECKRLVTQLRFVTLRWTPRETMVTKLGH